MGGPDPRTLIHCQKYLGSDCYFANKNIHTKIICNQDLSVQNENNKEYKLVISYILLKIEVPGLLLFGSPRKRLLFLGASLSMSTIILKFGLRVHWISQCIFKIVLNCADF